MTRKIAAQSEDGHYAVITGQILYWLYYFSQEKFTFNGFAHYIKSEGFGFCQVGRTE